MIRLSERPARFGLYAVAAVIGWTLCLTLLFLWQIQSLKKHVMELARIEARTAFAKDVVYRRWNASHGGVYVPVDENTPPNPYLDVPERDVVTMDGLRLTLINPAYMTRQALEMQKESKSTIGHITSANPIRPENSPDAWEVRALKSFNGQLKEYSSIELINGTEYMRLMRPLVAEAQCLRCHAKQGYKEGDLRGGISVGVPMKPYWLLYQEGLRADALSMGLVWFLGAGMIFLGASRLASKSVEMQKSEKTLRAITDTAQDAIVVYDRKGKVVFWSKGSAELFGCPAEEAIGSDLSDFLSDPEDENQTALAAITDTDITMAISTQIQLTGKRSDDTTFPVEVSLGTVSMEQGIFSVCVMRDITQRKQDEQALKKAKREAETANQAKSAFLANLTHEIRTPMNGIIGMTDLALETDLNLEQREYLETVKNSADSLHGLLNDILDLSKIEAGKLELEHIDFNLRSLLESTTHVFAAQAHSKGIELHVHIPPDTPVYLSGDPGRLRQVVVNLLGNAIKFTEKGEVVLRVETLKLPKEEQSVGTRPVRLCFTISDTGIGIPKDNIASIFESFKQADSSTTRRYGGTGLGLAISKQIVELMHGSIGVQSEFGRGSTFHFTTRFDSGSTIDQEDLSRADLTALRVLIVDDNETNRFILNEMLTGWGALAEEAHSALVAVNKIKLALHEGQPFELMILDYQMPRADGIELARIIHSDPELKGTKMIMLTSAALKGDMNDALDAGVERFLHKPVRQSQLLRSIMAVCRDPEKLAESSAGTSSPYMPDMQGTSYRVLLVEDNAINRKLVVRILEKNGHMVRTALNGREALDALERESFDLVLMDLQMPEMDGIEATRRIRESDGTKYPPSIPIVAITARAMKGDMEDCFNAGMDGYIAKPIKASEMLDTINKMMEQVTDNKQG